MTLKRCPDCLEKKKLNASNWYRNRSRPDGYASYCKPCMRARNDSYDPSPEARAKRKATQAAYDKTRDKSKRLAHHLKYRDTPLGRAIKRRHDAIRALKKAQDLVAMYDEEIDRLRVEAHRARVASREAP